MKFSVCIDAVFQGMDPCQAMQKAKDAGYDAFEFWSWWDKDIDAIAVQKKALGLELVLCCTKFVCLADAGQHEEYLRGLRESMAVVKRLGGSMLVTQSGAETDAPREQQRRNIIDGLRLAAPLLCEAGVTLLLEPLNKRDHPENYLVTAEETLEILRAVDNPNVRCLFDIYHQQISQDDTLTNLQECLPYIAHMHCAGVPDRAEPDEGELAYAKIFAALDAMGYQGRVGMEYFPRGEVMTGLARARALGGDHA